jgi:GH24 family phage-related lysozyme (muramidase)
MISKTYLLLSNNPIFYSDPSGLKIKHSRSGRIWTKRTEIGSVAYAKAKGFVKVNKKNKITHIKFHYNGSDPNINFGYGHIMSVDGGDIHTGDIKIYNKYLKNKGVTWENVNSKNIWVPVKECHQRFMRDFRFIVKKINTDLPKLKLTQKQADALIDLRYNFGRLPSKVFDACKTNNKRKIRAAIASTKGVYAPRLKSILKRFDSK